MNCGPERKQQLKGWAMTSSNESIKIALCGRPNVGKSSLFNRLIGHKKSIVLDQPGVTRDVVCAPFSLGTQKIELADLAGLELWKDRHTKGIQKNVKLEQKEKLRKLSVEAALDYLSKADLVLFVVDARAGLTSVDEELAQLVRTKNSKVICIAAKCEGDLHETANIEFASLGFGDVVTTSAEHNQGIEGLKETIGETLKIDIRETPEKESKEEKKENMKQLTRGFSKEKPIRIGVFGKPNVGKSTFVNALIGENRMITSEIAGTTVDSIDTDLIVDGKFYRILDTAGIRKKSKTEKGVEVLSVVRALQSLKDVDVAFFMIDGFEGISDQDEKIAGEILRQGKSCVLVVNKWDQCRIKKEQYAEKIRDTLGFLDFAPILFISAKNGTGIDGLYDLIEEILRQKQTMVPTPELNRFLEQIEGENNPMRAKLYYANQISKNPPTISISVNDLKKIHFSYEGYLKNTLRSRYGWMGSPLKLTFKPKKKRVES